MNTKLVTCIYNGLNGSKFCGRLNRDRPYNFSLSAIAKTGVDIECFTSQPEKQELENYFQNDRNITFHVQNLQDLDFHSEVNYVRDRKDDLYRQTPDWMNRCVEIMWGKFLFIKNVIQDNPNMEYVYWIDAGISHAGIIHSRFNSSYEHNIGFVRDLDKSTYPDTFKNDVIFNEKFMPALVKYTGDDAILNVASNNPQHPRLNVEHRFNGSAIGGIFGGRVALMDQYCDMVLAEFRAQLDRGILCKEEQIMTEILAAGKFPIKTFKFDTWYHPDWEDRYNEKQISFCNFFEEIHK